MKKIIPVFLLLFALANACAEEASTPKVIAYYFHGSVRCPTCHKIEQYSKEAIENNFKDALASGKLEFKAVNVEEKGNERFVNDYQLYTKSLVISLRDKGREVKSKNLTKVWEYVGNKKRFFDYVTTEINSFLKGA
ncbi:MAG: nitrophenyl compound nitroreductase subunit ArsF family protein [Candidatus Omnitrophota bacterium]